MVRQVGWYHGSELSSSGTGAFSFPAGVAPDAIR